MNLSLFIDTLTGRKREIPGTVDLAAIRKSITAELQRDALDAALEARKRHRPKLQAAARAREAAKVSRALQAARGMFA